MEKLLSNPIKLPALKTVKSSRVVDYLKAYSVSSLTSTKTDSFRPTRQSRESTSHRQIQSNFPSQSKKTESDTQRKNDLLYDISVAVSDKFEVLRDLATYEYELTQKTNIPIKLEKLLGSLGALPHVYEKGIGDSGEHEDITSLIDHGLKSLQMIGGNKAGQEFKAETFKIREYNTLRKMKIIFKAVRTISGIRVLICIKGDTFFEHFLVSVITCDTQFCMNVPVKLDILDVNTLNQEIRIESPVDEKIIPHLYLCYADRNLTIKYDKSFPSDKISVVFKLKVWGWTTAIIKSIEETISINVTDPRYERKISKSLLLTHDQSLQSISLKYLSSFLSCHLRFKGSKDEEAIEWCESADEEFRKKESGSKLMKEEYIKESLGTQQFVRVWQSQIVIEGQVYYIECFSYHSLLKLIVRFMEKTLEIRTGQHIKSEVDMLRFITNLQYFDIFKSPKTICQSLEMRKLIKSYFKLIH